MRDDLNEHAIERLRAAYALRGYHPLNRRKALGVEHWIGVGLLLAVVVVPAAAAAAALALWF